MKKVTGQKEEMEKTEIKFSVFRQQHKSCRLSFNSIQLFSKKKINSALKAPFLFIFINVLPTLPPLLTIMLNDTIIAAK